MARLSTQVQMKEIEDTLSSSAVKIIKVIQAALDKIRVLGLLESLQESTTSYSPSAPEKLKKAAFAYQHFATKFDRESEEQDVAASDDSFLSSDGDNLLNLVVTGAAENWEDQLSDTVPIMENSADFCRQIEVFQAVVLEMLSQTAKQWNKEEKFVKKNVKLSSINATIISKLECELPIARDAKEKAIKQKEGIVDEIQEDIDRIKRFSAGDIGYIRDNCKTVKAVIQSNSANDLEELEKARDCKKLEVERARSGNAEEHKKMRENVNDLKKSIIWIIDKYDSRMTELQKEFDLLWINFSKEMDRCRSVCTRYTGVKEIADTLRAENRRFYEETVRKRLEARLRNRAAIVIQRMWRKILQKRKPPPSDKKGKKKGKGKGKGKKKK